MKMKKVKFISLFLAAVSLANIGLTLSACGKGNDSESEEISASSPLEGTGTYLVKNGVSDYQILLPDDPADVEKTAADELNTLFYEATSVRLSIAYDKEYSPSQKYISLGSTKCSAAAGVTYDSSVLGTQGYKIVTAGDDLLIGGAGAYGTLYGVYGFLAESLDFDYYYTNIYELDRNVTELELMKYDITDVPDIEWRMESYEFLEKDENSYNRMRIMNRSNVLMSVGGKRWHNSLSYLPVEDYAEKHPDFYNSEQDQLCYTAHGNAAELEEMYTLSVEKLKSLFVAYPEMMFVSYSVQDNRDFCTCSACSESLRKYGTNSAVIIKYLNEISKRLDEWLAGEGKAYARDYKIIFFAYYSAEPAPVKTQAGTDGYLPIDESVVCAEHVCPFYAPIYYDYTKSLDRTSDDMTGLVETMKKWSAISTGLFMWSYDTNYRYYLVPYDSFESMQSMQRMAASLGARFMYVEGQAGNKNSTGWSALKQYLIAKLMWDSDADVDALTKKFFSYVYGVASEEMYSIYCGYRTLACYQIENGLTGGTSIYQESLSRKYWPKRVLAEWISLADTALEKIDVYSYDAATYKRYYRMIALERIAYEYLMVELYESSTPAADIQRYKDDVYSDALSLGVSQWRENEDINDLFTKWGY